MTTQHTPTPWGYHADSLSIVSYYESGRQLVAGFRSGTVSSDDALFIVRACNAHDELVAALRDIESRAVLVDGRIAGIPPRFIDAARAALAKVAA